MLEDVAWQGEFFDHAFFAYREDADLAWRAQWRGWSSLYVPGAIAWHRRRVTPERRSALPAEINRYSVRNRFLLRLKNQSPGLAWRFALPGLRRDALVVGYVLLREWSSIPGLVDVLRLLPSDARLAQARARPAPADFCRARPVVPSSRQDNLRVTCRRSERYRKIATHVCNRGQRHERRDEGGGMIAERARLINGAYVVSDALATVLSLALAYTLRGVIPGDSMPFLSGIAAAVCVVPAASSCASSWSGRWSSMPSACTGGRAAP